MDKVIKKTIIYRTLSLVSEFVIVEVFTGKPLIATGVTICCLIVHTALYYLIEKRI